MVQLTAGPDTAIKNLPSSTGDSAGIFTIWYRGRLVAYGRAGDTKETKPSNYRQADGVRGRIRGVLRQPGRPLQRRLHERFPEDWASAGGLTDEKRATNLLRVRGRCRIVRFESGEAARVALEVLDGELARLLQA
jgi:hypothetical protein